MTNGEFHHFDMNRRINVELDKLGFKVMNELFAEGEAYVTELADLKNSEQDKKRQRGNTTPSGRTKKGPTLREREPWG